MIHRDIKPGNIWLERPTGRVKILDFGLARAASGEEHLTQTGAMLGTPSYMAPEQGRGEETDARADLFSLGCVLYHAATGVRPFVGRDTLSTLLAVTTHQPRPPAELNPALPAALSELILSLLAKDRESRPLTAHEVAQRLDSIGNGLRAVPQSVGNGLRAVPQAADAALLPLPPGEGRGEGALPVDRGQTAVLRLHAADRVG